MRDCPLVLDVGCQYGVNLKCPEKYEDCCFYQLNERTRQMNELAQIQLTASKLEKDLLARELKLWQELREK